MTEAAAPLDLLVVNGRVVVPESGEVQAGIGVAGGRIAGLFEPGARPAARAVIDVSGKVVLPGVIDPHTHVTLGPPDGWFTETRAAAVAGITTVLDFQLLASSYLEAFARIRAEAGDEGAYLGVAGTDDGYFYDLCRRVVKHARALLCVHAENIEIARRLQARAMAEGREGLHAWGAARPPVTEAENVNRAAFFSRETGCPIYVVHLSSAAALREARLARRRGVRLHVETCPQYLAHTADSPLGLLAKSNPPLRAREDVEALWEGLADGAIDTVGSDHVPRARAAKDGTTWTASRGTPTLSMIVPVLLSEGVHRRGLSLARVAELISTTPARLFNLYPRKGTIQVGSDADLTVIDLDLEREVHWQDLQSYADYTLWEGQRLRGWPVLTILRGQVIARDGMFLGAPGAGRYLPR